MFYKLTLKKKDVEISNLERKKYIQSLFPHFETFSNNKKKDQGFLIKFANALGFKPVCFITDNTGVVISPTIESPSNYISPDSYLSKSLRVSFEKNEVFSFYIEAERIQHAISQYSYYSKGLLLSFEKFLNKIFPNLETEFITIDCIPEYSFKDKILNRFFVDIEEKFHVSCEVVSANKLTEQECEEILEVLREICPFNIEIGQHICTCESCKEATSSDTPNFIEIIYKGYKEY